MDKEELRKVEQLDAPWNEDQIKSLNSFQYTSAFEPQKCSVHSEVILEAMQDGWCCDQCEPSLRQNWCRPWMADWSWLNIELPDPPDY